MARFTFKLPDIGEGISEAEIVAWHVAVGDRVEEDQSLADMMTDKATVEMESPVAGVVVEIAGAVGDQVSIGAPLVVIETEGEGEVAAPATEPDTLEAENPGVEEASPLPAREGPGVGDVSNDANPERDAPSKPESHDRSSKINTRSVETTWQQIGSLLDAFPPHECANYLRNSGYAST
ncbi:Dihydrolipoamide acetyltransferase component of pyruvate dehydrogenase complex (fragment) [Sphingomonas sp. 8AM]